MPRRAPTAAAATVSSAALPLLLLLPLLLAAPAAAQPAAEGGDAAQRGGGLSWRDGRPTLSTPGGGFTLSPVLRLDADIGSFFGQNRPEGFRSGVNLRRGRLGVEGEFLGDFEYNFTWDFGGSSPNDYSELEEASIAWKGLGWATLRAGVFGPQHLAEYASSSFDLLFLERAAVSNVAASLASGSTRVGAGIEAHGPRWAASGYVTSGELTRSNDLRQTGLAGRAAALAVDRDGLQVQLGLNGAYQFRPGTRSNPDEISLGDYPERRVDSRQFLDTGDIDADAAWAAGPEAIAAIGRLYLQAEYQRIVLDAERGGTRRFDGWYVQGAYVLVGEARSRDAESATWERPGAREPFDPLAGRWGALEVAGRYSAMDLQDGPVRGGVQRIWTGALNWYPTRQLRLAVQYQYGTLALDDGDRRFQAIGLRAAFNL